MADEIPHGSLLIASLVWHLRREPARFEPPAPGSGELRVLDTEDQCFVRCAECRFDNYLTATRCRHCEADLTAPAQRAFTEMFWRKRAEEKAEEERELEVLRQRRARADQEAAAAMRQLAEIEQSWATRRTFGMPWEERHGFVQLAGLGGRRLGAAIGEWAWRTFPNRSIRILFFVALGATFVGLAFALLPTPLVVRARLYGDLDGHPVDPRLVPQAGVGVSQSVEMVIVVQGLAELIRATLEAGLRYEPQKEFRTTDGRDHAVDIVVSDEAGTQVGVKVDKKTGVAAFVGHDEKNRGATKLANRIAQRYAYSKALDELKRKGYQIAKEEKQKDGTIKLVAQRWR